MQEQFLYITFSDFFLTFKTPVMDENAWRQLAPDIGLSNI